MSIKKADTEADTEADAPADIKPPKDRGEITSRMEPLLIAEGSRLQVSVIESTVPVGVSPRGWAKPEAADVGLARELLSGPQAHRYVTRHGVSTTRSLISVQFWRALFS